MLALTAAALLSGNALAQETDQEVTAAKAGFVDGEGNANGNAELTAVASGGVLIKVEITGLPTGEWVAFHVHETGSCDHTTAHKSAGGHFNPGSNDHGFMAASGPHAGDMPNQYVAEDGTLRTEVFNGMVTLDDGEAGIKGRALMIHAKADDYESQPSGDAGDRLACAVIE
ncbi:MAG: superoxide dismutase family protein [Pseudomonadota bacterium]|nr:superoxide dismutase family protein [Pseudomonadota bacterium]